MKHIAHSLATLATAFLLSLLATACVDEETTLGLSITDPSTLYHAKADTLYANQAFSFRDTSLIASDQNYNIVGNYSDPTFGRVESELFTQLALPSNTSTLNFDTIVIDSVVLTLVKEQIFPDSNASLNLMFEVSQLAEPVLDTAEYKAYDSLPTVAGEVLHLAPHIVGPSTSEVRLPLSGNIRQILDFSGNNADFKLHAKGLRIRIKDAQSDDGMVSFNFAATKTRLTAYYHLGADTTKGFYDFSLARPFMHFRHHYAGTSLGDNRIDGADRLYLQPLAGYNVRLVFDSALAVFHTAHPQAIVHQAELVMSVAAGDYGERPATLSASKVCADSTETYISDYAIAGSGLSSYSPDSDSYRIRLPRHLQGLLRSGIDFGTTIAIDSRRYTTPHTVLNGLRSPNRPYIAIVYSE